MGDPKKSRKKYETPSHPWQRARIEEESELQRKYGLKNKREIWKARALLRKFRKRARELVGRVDEKGFKEKEELVKKLYEMGILQSEDATIDDILSLTAEDILERRLQTIVYKKGLARTIRQARQFIVHGHVRIGDRRVNVPSYLVYRDEEGLITCDIEMQSKQGDANE